MEPGRRSRAGRPDLAGGQPPLLVQAEVREYVRNEETDVHIGVELLGAGAEVELHTYDGADHLWLGAPDAAVDALDRTVGFLRRHLIERN